MVIGNTRDAVILDVLGRDSAAYVRTAVARAPPLRRAGFSLGAVSVAAARRALEYGLHAVTAGPSVTCTAIATGISLGFARIACAAYGCACSAGFRFVGVSTGATLLGVATCAGALSTRACAWTPSATIFSSRRACVVRARVRVMNHRLRPDARRETKNA